MKEYKFIKLDLGIFSREPEEDYREIIVREALEEWELVQIFAPPISGYGCAKYYELIFSREV